MTTSSRRTFLKTLTLGAAAAVGVPRPAAVWAADGAHELVSKEVEQVSKAAELVSKSGELRNSG